MKKSAGTIITILAAVMITAFSAVTVSAAGTEIKSIELSSTTVTLEAGDHAGLNVSVAYSGEAPSESLTWTSSDSSVASISNGTVVAKHEGTATVTATLGDQSDSCTIIVNSVPPTQENTAAAYKELNSVRKAYNSRVGKSKKLRMLRRDKKLERIALVRAKEIAETGQFSHTRPNGKSGLTLIKGHKAKGENIAMGQTSCEEVTDAWYASPGHRKNMLRKNFRKVGIAGYTYNGVTYWAQVFSS